MANQSNVNLQYDFSPAPGAMSNLQRQLNAALQGINANVNVKVAGGAALTGMSKDVSQFTKSLDAANTRVLAFTSSLAVLGATARVFKGIVDSTIEVEKSIRDINSVFKLSSTELDKFSKSLFDTARATGSSFDTAAEAAKEFSRQGLSASETIKRTRDALILTRLAAVDTADAVDTLTAAVNGFQKEGLNTTTILNKLATVDSAFAVSSKDLAQGLSRAGAAAADAGVSFDQLVALITSAQQTTARGGAVIGNALKTIFTRVERKDTIDALEGLGIAVKDVAGNTLPVIQVLENFAKSYDKLGGSVKQQAAQLLGGVYQINILKAVLADLGKAQSVYAQAQNISANSTDEAIKRNEELNKSLASLLSQFQTTSKQIGSNLGSLSFAGPLKTVLGGLIDNPVTKALEDASGQAVTTGGKIAEGVLKGFGNVLIYGLGPLLAVALGRAIGSTGQKVGAYLKGAAGIGANPVTQEQAQQEQLNKTYSEGELALKKQLAVMTALVEKSAQLNANMNSATGSKTQIGNVQASASGSLSMGGFPLLDKKLTPARVAANTIAQFNKVYEENYAEQYDKAYEEELKNRNIKITARTPKKTLATLDTAATNKATLRTNNIANAQTALYSTDLQSQQSGLTTLSFAKSEASKIIPAIEARGTGFSGLFGTSRGDYEAAASAYGGKLTKRQRGIAELPLQALQQQRAQRLNRLNVSAAFIAPALAGFVPEGEGGTSSGQALGATSGALKGAGVGGSLGAIFPAIAPVAIAAGAFVGGLLGLFGKLNKSFEELAKEIQDANAKSGQQISAATDFARAQQDLIDGVQGGASPRKIQQLLGQQTGALSRVTSDADRSALANATTSDQVTDVISAIVARISREVQGRDVLSSIGKGSEGRSSFLGLRYGGFQSSDLEGTAQTLASTFNASANKDVFEQFKKDSGDAALAFTDLAKSLGHSSEQIAGELKAFADRPEDLKTVLTRFREISEQQIKDAANAAEALKRQVANVNLGKLLRESAADLGASGQINEAAGLSQVKINTDRSRFANGLLGSGGVNQLRANNTVNLDALQRENALKQDAGFTKAIAAALDKAGQEAEKKFAPQDFTQKLQGASNENDLKALADTLGDTFSPLREVLLGSYKELTAIREQGKIATDELKQLQKIAEVQAQLEQRNNILANSRYSQGGSDQFFTSSLIGNGQQFGRFPRAQQQSALLDQIGSLDKGGLPETSDTRGLRDSLRQGLAKSDFADKLSTILGRDIEESDLSGAIDEVLKRPIKTVQDAVNNNTAQRIKLGVNSLGFTNEDAIKQIGGGGANYAALASAGKISIGDQGIAQALSPLQTISDRLGDGSPIVTALQGISQKLSDPRKSISDNERLAKAQTTVTQINEKIGNLNQNNLQSGLENAFGGVGDRRTNRLNAIFPVKLAPDDGSTGPSDGSFQSLQLTAEGKANEIIRQAFAKSTNVGETFKDLTKPGISDLSRALPGQDLAKYITDQIKGSKFGNAFSDNGQARVAKATNDLTDATKDLTAAQAAVAKNSTNAFLGNYGRNKSGNSTELAALGEKIPNLRTGLFTSGIYSQGGSNGFGPLRPGGVGGRLASSTDISGLGYGAKPPRVEAAGDVQLQIDVLQKTLSYQKAYGEQSTIILETQLQLNEALRKQQLILGDISEADLRLSNVKGRRDAIEGNPFSSGSQIEGANLAVAQEKGLQGDSIGSFADGFSARLKGLKRDLQDFSDVGASVSRSLEGSLGNAFGEFVVGAKNAKDAGRDFLVSFGNEVAKTFANKAIQQLLGIATSSISNFFTPSSTSTVGTSGGGGLQSVDQYSTSMSGGAMGFASGGKVPALVMGGEFYFSPQAAKSVGYDTLHKLNKYAGGGMVTGGSGTKDDVPANLPQGSFIVKKSAVQKLGAGYLQSLADGRALRRAGGGYTTNVIAGQGDTGGGGLQASNQYGEGTGATSSASYANAGYSAAIALAIGAVIALTQKTYKLMSESEARANVGVTEAAQQSSIDNRPAGSSVYLIPNGSGGYSSITSGAEADVKKFAGGGMAMLNGGNRIPFADGGEVMTAPMSSSDVGTPPPKASSGSNVGININITNNNGQSSSSSTTTSPYGDKDFATKMQKAVDQRVKEVLADEFRTGGLFQQRQRYSQTRVS